MGHWMWRAGFLPLDSRETDKAASQQSSPLKRNNRGDPSRFLSSPSSHQSPVPFRSIAGEPAHAAVAAVAEDESGGKWESL